MWVVWARYMDVELHYEDSFACLVEDRMVPSSAALFVQCDLDYVHKWRGFCQVW